MAYCSLDDLIARAGAAEILQIADRDLDGTADPAVVSAAIDQAGTLIDGYVAARHAVPLAPVPALVQGIAVAIARYTLHRDGAPDYVVRDWNQAIAQLKDIQAGRLTIAGAAGLPAPPAPHAGGMGVASGTPAFSDAALAGWLS